MFGATLRYQPSCTALVHSPDGKVGMEDGMTSAYLSCSAFGRFDQSTPGKPPELLDDGGLHLLGQHEVGELQRGLAMGGVGGNDRLRETAAQREVGELHEAGGLRQHALGDRLQHLVGPGRDHGHRALGEQLQRGGVAGGVGALLVKRRREIVQHGPGLGEHLVGRSLREVCRP